MVWGVRIFPSSTGGKHSGAPFGAPECQLTHPAVLVYAECKGQAVPPAHGSNNFDIQ